MEKDLPPFVRKTSLEDYYSSYQVNGYIRQPNSKVLRYSDMRKEITDTFHAAGIEVMSPHFHAARDGSSSNIPHQDPNNTKSAGIRININKDQ